jgi:hypothetical protein
MLQLSSVEPAILCNKAQISTQCFHSHVTSLQSTPTTGLPTNDNYKPILWSRISSVILLHTSNNARCFDFFAAHFSSYIHTE